MGTCTFLKAALACVALSTSVAPANAQPPGAGSSAPNWFGRRDWNPGERYKRDFLENRSMVRADPVYRTRTGQMFCRRSDGSIGRVFGTKVRQVGGRSGYTTLGAVVDEGSDAKLAKQVDAGKIRCR